MSGRARILVAEDDPDLLAAVSTALQRLGAEVLRAESGAELIQELADQGPVDLVVTDISMPWMSGLQAMFSARTAGVTTPIIVITALADEDIPEKVEALGAACLLRKPFDVSDLEAAVTHLLPNEQEPEQTSEPLGAPRTD